MAVVYVITAWVLIQVAGEVAEPLHLPGWFSTAVIVLLALGFPVALGLAWALEVRPEGSGDEAAADASDSLELDDESNPHPAPHLITRRSVAVLSFENVSNDSDAEQVATGLTEEILNNLSRMQDLKVASRASILAYTGTALRAAEIGTELGVSYLVEGSIRKIGDSLRITAQLIRTPDDEHIWAQTFERDISDGFAMQEKLAQVIARQVQANMQTDVSILAARRQTQNERAYRHFRIAAEERWQQVSGDHDPNWKLVLENFRRAVELDPDFAVAHEGIANVCVFWPELDITREEASRTAHAALERAMALRPPSAFSYMHLAQIFANVDANYPAALEAIEKGVALAPNMAWLHVLLHAIALRQGRVSDAMKHVRTGVQLSPGDSLINHFFGQILWLRGDYAGAIKAMQTSLENMSGGGEYVRRSANLARLYLESGETDRANEILDKVLRSPGYDPGDLGPLCLTLAAAGRDTDLQRIKGELLSEYGSHWFPGRYQIHLAAGELDEAFDYLHQGIDHRFGPEVVALRCPPSFMTPMVEDARWQQVITHLEKVEARAAAGE